MLVFTRLTKILGAKRNNLGSHSERATGHTSVGYRWLWVKGASLCFVFLLARLLQPNFVAAESVVVRYPEGVAHGFLVLRKLDGKTIADGESTQVAHGDRVTNRMRFTFTDGSVYEQTTVFLQNRTFHLVSDHVLQKGPTFECPMETAIDTASGQVTVCYKEHNEEKVLSKRLQLPPDVANGMVFAVLKT